MYVTEKGSCNWMKLLWEKRSFCQRHEFLSQKEVSANVSVMERRIVIERSFCHRIQFLSENAFYVKKKVLVFIWGSLKVPEWLNVIHVWDCDLWFWVKQINKYIFMNAVIYVITFNLLCFYALCFVNVVIHKIHMIHVMHVIRVIYVIFKINMI